MFKIDSNLNQVIDRNLRWHFGWEFKTTRQYFKKNPPKIGEYLLAVSTQASMLTYEIAAVNRVNNRTIQLDKQFTWAGPSFYYSGKNCFSPKGRTRVVPLKKEMSEHFINQDISKIEFSTLYEEDQINDLLVSVNA